jgi:hypothetical protein
LILKVCVTGGGEHHKVREATASEAEEGELGGGAAWGGQGVQALDSTAASPCGEASLGKMQAKMQFLYTWTVIEKTHKIKVEIISNKKFLFYCTVLQFCCSCRHNWVTVPHVCDTLCPVL